MYNASAFSKPTKVKNNEIFITTCGSTKKHHFYIKAIRTQDSICLKVFFYDVIN